MRRLVSLALALALPIPAAAQTLEAAAASHAKPKIVVIDAGHGGRDQGAIFHGLKEKDLARSIADKLQLALAAVKGLAARETREGDRYLGLADRVDKAKELGGKAMVSIHADDIRGGGERGVVLYYYGRFRKLHPRPGVRVLSDPPRSQVRASRELARHLHKSLREHGIPVRGIDRAAYVVLKSPRIPSVLVEVGNLRDGREAGRMADPEFQELVSRALAQGLGSYLQVSEPILAASAR